MRTVTTLALFAFLLCCAGCGNKIDSKLAELAAKPAATTLEDAQKLHAEAAKFLRWIEAKENPSPEQLATAKALLQKREDELVALGGKKVLTVVSKVLGSVGIDIKSVDLSKTTDWILGVNDPRMKKFACKDKDGVEVDVTKEGAAKLCW